MRGTFFTPYRTFFTPLGEHSLHRWGTFFTPLGEHSLHRKTLRALIFLAPISLQVYYKIRIMIKVYNHINYLKAVERNKTFTPFSFPDKMIGERG